jgi:thioredoxin 1
MKRAMIGVALVLVAGLLIWRIIDVGLRPGEAGGPGDDAAATQQASESQIEHVTEATFASEVHESPVPVLVDFYADWCGPCRMLSPVLEEFARETPGAKVVKVNVDEEPGLAERYAIRSIPSLLVFDGGEVTDKHVGLASKSELNALVRR